MNKTILIVEDEIKLSQTMADYLTSSNYQVQQLTNGNEVTAWVKQHQPDLVLLDIMLPGQDGISVCRELRTFSQVPIIMLTARIEEVDRLLGLELGADDYVCKPYSPREVVARVKAIFRRIDSLNSQTAQTKNYIIDDERFKITVMGRDLDLTPVEFRLLKHLMNNPQTVFHRDQLTSQIYDDHRIVSSRTVDSHIKNLRKKLKEAIPEQELVRSVYGVGYTFELS